MFIIEISETGTHRTRSHTYKLVRNAKASHYTKQAGGKSSSITSCRITEQI